MKEVIVIIFAVLLMGCNVDAIQIQKVGDFKVELLFEVDGCKVYRFYDGGLSNPKYLTTCKGETQWSYSTRTGKSTTTHDESITTNIIDTCNH